MTIVRTLVVVVIVEVVCCVALVLYAMAWPRAHPAAMHSVQEVVMHKETPPPQKQEVIGLPMRLRIPAINVDTALDYVGLTSTGELDTPKGPSNAGWFNLSPLPGEKGISIIDGHFGWIHNTPAVFDNLHAIKVGDNVYAEDEHEVTYIFVVRELKTYAANQDPRDVFVPGDDKAHLNLITCQGDWIETRKSYSARLIVLTDRVIK
jgi:LPXTG-site transpeptidase (sortase) family protein